jgi:hypothetical protein
MRWYWVRPSQLYFISSLATHLVQRNHNPRSSCDTYGTQTARYSKPPSLAAGGVLLYVCPATRINHAPFTLQSSRLRYPTIRKQHSPLNAIRLHRSHPLLQHAHWPLYRQQHESVSLSLGIWSYPPLCIFINRDRISLVLRLPLANWRHLFTHMATEWTRLRPRPTIHEFQRILLHGTHPLYTRKLTPVLRLDHLRISSVLSANNYSGIPDLYSVRLVWWQALPFDLGGFSICSKCSNSQSSSSPLTSCSLSASASSERRA